MERPISTFSIVARDPTTGEMGVAVESRYFSVGSVVPWAEAGVGAVATQSFANLDYGPRGLDLLRAGLNALQALTMLVENDPGRDIRQAAMVDAAGNVAVHTGQRCVMYAGHRLGETGFTVQGNMLADEGVLAAMHDAYTAAEGDLANRMLVALDAGQEAGGDIRGQQSAAILVVAGERLEKPWLGRLLDLRVEDHSEPIEELARLVAVGRAFRFVDQAAGAVAQGDPAAAEDAIQLAIALAPDRPDILFWAALGLYTSGDREKALGLFREIFAAAPAMVAFVPRVAAAGLMPLDGAAVEEILREATA